MTVFSDSAQAQSVQILSYSPGSTITYTGQGIPGSTVSVMLSSSVTTPVSDGHYEYRLSDINVPACSVTISVNPVQTITFGGKQWVDVPFVGGGYLPEITLSVSPSGTTGSYIYNAGGGKYDVRVFGDAVPAAGSVTVDVYVSQQVHVDDSGTYIETINTANLPAGVYYLSQDNLVVAEIYLGVDAPLTYTLNLRKGWNLISLPIVPRDNRITSLFTADQLNNIKIMWDYNGGQWRYFTTRQGYSPQFTTISEQKGYYVYCYSAMSVQAIGSAGSGVISYDSLAKGWNIIGYPSQSITSVADVYKSAYIVWKYQNGNWFFYANRTGYSPQFTTLEPALGYWVRKK